MIDTQAILAQFGFEDGDECRYSPHGWHEFEHDFEADSHTCIWCTAEAPTAVAEPKAQRPSLPRKAERAATGDPEAR